MKVNSTAGALLGLLHRGPMTGWQLAQLAEVSLCDFWNVNRSQVYRELGQLAERGLVEAGEKGVRDQVPYTITDTGRDAFQAWLQQDPGPEIMRSPLHLKLSFAEHLDDATRTRFVRLHQLRNEERLAYYRSIERTMGDAFPYQKHVLRSGIAYREGLLAWLDSLPWGHERNAGTAPDPPATDAAPA